MLRRVSHSIYNFIFISFINYNMFQYIDSKIQIFLKEIYSLNIHAIYKQNNLFFHILFQLNNKIFIFSTKKKIMLNISIYMLLIFINYFMINIICLQKVAKIFLHLSLLIIGYVSKFY